MFEKYICLKNLNFCPNKYVKEYFIIKFRLSYNCFLTERFGGGLQKYSDD